jgi:hypothetical protein
MATPYTTTCGISLTSIDGTDCIGDSRNNINNNIQNLGTAICQLSAEVFNNCRYLRFAYVGNIIYSR